GARLTGAQVAALPPAARSVYEHAYVNALSPVFLAAAGVTFAGFALSWLMQERTLRQTAATSTGLEDALAAPRSPDSLAEVERAIACVFTPDQREAFRQRLSQRAGLELSSGATWALLRIGEHGFAGARRFAGEIGVPPERIQAALEELRSDGILAHDGGAQTLTPKGRSVAKRALDARREELDRSLADPEAARTPEVR